VVGKIVGWVAGVREPIPEALLGPFPELGVIRLRRGGLPPRISGWLLGSSTVDGVTLWRTVWLGRRTKVTAELLLHELRHVEQFGSVGGFPLRYVLASLRHGYSNNPFEREARQFASSRIRRQQADPFSEDVELG
jgi:hypothetical protein